MKLIIRDYGKAHVSHGKAQSFCDWKNSCFAWKGSASLETSATKDWGLLK